MSGRPPHLQVEKPDIDEHGAGDQVSTTRLFMQLVAFGECTDTGAVVEAVKAAGIPAVVYEDMNDARGVALLTWSPDPAFFVTTLRGLLQSEPFASLWPKQDLTMIGRSYTLGHEPDVKQWLFDRPINTATNADEKWAVWYPLRRAGAFEKLEPGNWIAQNAASSAVGKLVIQFAARQGLRCACLVRSTETAPRLRELGADAVFADDADASESALSATGGERPKLALNAVGGPSAYALAKMLAPGGTHVTYGGMTRELAPFPTRQLIFDDIRLRGFWVSEWYRRAPRSEVEATLDEIYCACEIANVATDIEAVYRLDQWQKALKRAVKPGKTGKVLFDMEAA